MNAHRYTNSTAAFAHVAASFVLLIAPALAASAQQSQPNRSRRPNPIAVMRNRNAKMIEREAILSELRKPPAKAVAPTPGQLIVLKQIRDDFQQIQLLNNQMMSVAVSGNPLSHKQLADQAAEINKRASRLQSNLSLPESKKEEKSLPRQFVAVDEEIKALLITLDKHLVSFVSNSYFKNPSQLNVEQFATAGSDLQNVIELSASIKKKCKGVKQNH
jgi:hypothetical protein